MILQLTSIRRNLITTYTIQVFFGYFFFLICIIWLFPLFYFSILNNQFFTSFFIFLLFLVNTVYLRFSFQYQNHDYIYLCNIRSQGVSCLFILFIRFFLTIFLTYFYFCSLWIDMNNVFSIEIYWSVNNNYLLLFCNFSFIPFFYGRIDIHLLNNLLFFSSVSYPIFISITSIDLS